jgi:hypothetical protein
MAASNDANALRPVFEPLVDRYSSQPLASAGLVISSTATKAKIGAADFHAVVKGKLVTIVAGTDMPVLVGSITAASFNVFCFFIDGASVVTVAMGTEGTTRNTVKFPTFTKEKSLVGFLIVTYASTFVGGTTALSTATTQFISPLGAFDPSVLI